MSCTICYKPLRARLVDGEWQLIECDHSPDDVAGIDWAAFKAEQLDNERRASA